METLIGLDLGEKRTGVALAVDGRVVKAGTATSPTEEELAGEIAQLVLSALRAEYPFEQDHPESFPEARNRYGITRLVVGLPLTPTGREGTRASQVRQRAEEIALRLGLEVVFVDERFTTRAVEAHRRASALPGKPSKLDLDQEVAAELLRSYLARREVVEG